MLLTGDNQNCTVFTYKVSPIRSGLGIIKISLQYIKELIVAYLYSLVVYDVLCWETKEDVWVSRW